MVWTTLDSSEREIWHYVTRLESFDFVAALHRKYHGEPAKDDKVRQVNAAFSQGRMYFESGSRAEMGVRPLLLYYGAMSLAAGLVVFKAKGRTVPSLKPSHGLRPGAWAESLRQGLGGILDLSVSAVPGTFQAFATTLWHWHAVMVGLNTRLQPELMDLGCVGLADGKSSVTLGDLLARSRYTGGGYGEVANAPYQLHRGGVYLDGGELAFRPGNATIQELGMEEAAGIFGGRLRFPWGDPGTPVFHCIERGDGNSVSEMCMIEQFPNGDRLSELVKLYLLSYILGMVARYFPSEWIGLLRNEPEGGAQPLLARATGAIETEFIREFAQQIAVLVDDRYFFGVEFGDRASRGPLNRAWQDSRESRRDSRRHMDDIGQGL